MRFRAGASSSLRVTRLTTNRVTATRTRLLSSIKPACPQALAGSLVGLALIYLVLLGALRF